MLPTMCPPAMKFKFGNAQDTTLWLCLAESGVEDVVEHTLLKLRVDSDIGYEARIYAAKLDRQRAYDVEKALHVVVA